MNSEDNLDFTGIYVGYDLEYTLDAGENLISFPHPVPTGIGEALPGYAEQYFTGIIGEGMAASQIAPQTWVGSLNELQGGDGYWVKVTFPFEFSFENPDSVIILSPDIHNLRK